MGLEERWQRRWASRSATPQGGAAPTAQRTYRLHEAVKLRQPPEVVWALVSPVETAPLLSPDSCARAYVYPGTGPGIGEVQVFVGHDGATQKLLVVEWEEGRRAVAQVVTNDRPLAYWTVTALTPLGEGCILTHGVEAVGDASAAWPSPAEDQRIRDDLRKYLERVRAVLAADEA